MTLWYCQNDAFPPTPSPCYSYYTKICRGRPFSVSCTVNNHILHHNFISKLNDIVNLVAAACSISNSTLMTRNLRLANRKQRSIHKCSIIFRSWCTSLLTSHVKQNYKINFILRKCFDLWSQYTFSNMKYFAEEASTHASCKVNIFNIFWYHNL